MRWTTGRTAMAALQQLLVRSVSDGLGGKAVFLCLFCAAALLSPLCVREMRMLIRAVRSGAKETPAPDGHGVRGPAPSVEPPAPRAMYEAFTRASSEWGAVSPARRHGALSSEARVLPLLVEDTRSRASSPPPPRGGPCSSSR